MSSSLAAGDAPSPFQQAQETKRKQRQAVLVSCAKDLDAARNRGLAGIEKFLTWAAENGLAGNTVDLYRTVVRAYPTHAWPASLRASYATPPPPSDDKTKLTTWQTRRENALQGHGNELISLVRACAAVRMYDKAYDILQEILRVSPDDRNARSFLGYLPVINSETRRREWLWKADANHRSRGEVWIDGVGWVPQAQVERHRKGEYFENGRWSSMEEANRRHAEVENAWVIEGPHFTLRSTLNRADALAIATALEEYHRTVYKDFLGFFAQDGKAINAIFDTGVAARPMVVHYFATKDQYDTFIRTKMTASRNVELLLASDGFYSYKTGECYFFKSDDQQSDLQAAFHETTHQILGEFIRSSNSTAWVVEMPAVYMEYVSWQNGRILTPPWALANHNRAARLDKEFMTVAAYTALTRDQFHSEDEKVRLLHYSMAGGLADFLMNAENGVYREAFMEYCRDSYLKGGIAPLNEYLGINMADLEAQWKAHREKTYVGLTARKKALAARWQAEQAALEANAAAEGAADSSRVPSASRPAAAVGAASGAKPAQTPPAGAIRPAATASPRDADGLGGTH